MRGKMSDLLRASGISMRRLYATNASFSLVIAILYDPFCSLESPSCQADVPLGRPMLTTQAGSSPMILRLTLSSNGICRRVSWASNKQHGIGPPGVRGYTLRSSSSSKARANIGEVIDPFGDIATMAGILLPSNSQYGAPGNAFPTPI